MELALGHSTEISATASIPVKRRDPWMDNARWVAGTLVVTLHTITPYLEVNEGAKLIDSATWALRLPLFSMLVGFFTVSTVASRVAGTLVRTVVIPLATLTLLQVLLRVAFTGEFHFSLLRPEFALWFLYAVIIWRGVLPYIAALRFPLVMGPAVGIGAGFFAELSLDFALSRVTGFFPFFMLGWWLAGNNGWLRNRTLAKTVGAVGVLGAAMLLVMYLERDDSIDRTVVGMIYPYPSGLDAQLHAAGARSLIILGGALVVLAFFYIVPRRSVPFISYLGAGGFYMYMLHPLVILTLQHLGFIRVLFNGTGLLGLVAFAFGLAAFLASPPMRWLARPMVQPRLRWLFRSEATARTDRNVGPTK